MDNYSASATVLTGLLFALVTIAVAWGTSFLKPPVAEQSSPTTAQAQAQAVPEPEPVNPIRYG